MLRVLTGHFLGYLRAQPTYRTLLRQRLQDIVEGQAAGGLALGLSFKRLRLHGLPFAILT